MDHKDSDEELVRSLQKGDVIAFDRLFDRYGRRILSFARGYMESREEAEGLVQEVFIRVWENRENIKEHLSFRSYLFTISYNLVRNYFRAKYREREFLEEIMRESSGPPDDASRQVEYLELIEEIDHVVEKLPFRQQQVFRLSREDGKSHKEIARILSIQPKTVENHLHEAIKKIKKQLRKKGLLYMLFVALFM